MVGDANWTHDVVKEVLASDDKAATKDGGIFSALPGFLIGTLLTDILEKKKQSDLLREMQIMAASAARKASQHTLQEHEKQNRYTAYTGNLARDLKIMFTFSNVVYMLHGTPIDILNTAQMNEEMKQAWETRNAEYFRSLFLNKVYLDMHAVEQHSLKSVVDRDAAVRNSLAGQQEKTAEDQLFDPFDTLYKIGELQSLFDKKPLSAPLQKYAAFLDRLILSMPKEEIELSFSKAGDFNTNGLYDLISSEKLAFLGVNHAVDQRIFDKNDLFNNIKTSFLPDRVVFSSRDTVLFQVNPAELDDDAYDAYQQHNEGYFKNRFFNLLGDLKKHEKTATISYEEQLEKKAASHPLAELFKRDDIHPRIYLLIMNSLFTPKWADWSNEVIIKTLEEQLGLHRIESDLALNKLLFVKVILKSDTPLNGYHTFEKLVRAFNNKHIDFSEREPNWSLGEMIFAIKVLSEILGMKSGEAFDAMSDDVLGYIKEVLFDEGQRAALPKAPSDLEGQFYEILNGLLMDVWNDSSTKDVTDANITDMIKTTNRAIVKVSSSLLDSYRKTAKIPSEAILRQDAKTLLGNYPSGVTEAALLAVIATVYQNLATDLYLKEMDTILTDQIKFYVNP